MIRLTRLRQSDPLYVNPDHIERLHRLHETVVHLLNGNEYVVVESPEEIVEQITHFRARAIALAARMAIDGIDAAVMNDVRAAALVSPLPAIDEADFDEPQPTLPAEHPSTTDVATTDLKGS
jgi:uncharacterized protein YlzI (FlbEa/FlbD family)